MPILQEITVPLLAVNDTSLTVAELAFAPGAGVKNGDVIMVLETSKTTYDVTAEVEGYIQYLCEQGNDYEVNTIIARIYSEMTEAAEAPLPGVVMPALQLKAGSLPARTSRPATGARTAQLSPAASFWEGETRFSREAARLLETAGVDKSVFAGKDLVIAADVRAFLEPAAPLLVTGGSTPATASRQRQASAVLPADPAKVIVEKLSSGKRREIDYLSDVQAPGLTSTINIYVETEGIFTFINRSLHYLKDSLLPVIIYETGRLLTRYPLLNGYFTGESIALYKEVNPGFAIDIDKGLKVLKIAAAGQKNIEEIEKEILGLSGQYLDDTLQIDQLTNITFTITDLSSENVAFFRPLVNKMNSAILGISSIDEKLQRCALSLTFDHRMTEGKQAARFLYELKERLESYRPKEMPADLDVSCFKCYKRLKEDLGGTGFARCITPEGKEGYICQSCLKGF
jgi:pyruvate/2-oxoglutarate dehydrogenase complex dihydrolipoamide acyltransferase (E2) component